MKKCLNCEKMVREQDKYCRNCGCLLQSNENYILTNIMISLVVIGIIVLIVLFIASYLVL